MGLLDWFTGNNTLGAQRDIQNAYWHGLNDGWRYRAEYPDVLPPGPSCSQYGPLPIKHHCWHPDDRLSRQWQHGRTR
jgi:hypothetical protein